MVNPVDALAAGSAAATQFVRDVVDLIDGRAPSPSSSPSARPKLLTCRVDHLRIGLAVELRPEVAALVRRRGARANAAGGASLQIGDFLCELRPSRTKNQWHWRALGRGLRGTIDLDARPARGSSVLVELAHGHPGFTLEVIIDGARLLETPSLSTVLELVDDVARKFGRCVERRLRRFDLCADFVAFELSDDLGHRFLLPRGCKNKGVLGSWVPEIDDDDDCARAFASSVKYRNVDSVTGYTVCPGNTVMMRIYDKTIELKLPGRESKRPLEEARWKSAGWDGQAPVTRVEFQIRSAALDEAALRDPTKLDGALDAAWQYLTRRWVRLTVPLSASRRYREETDPRWRGIQAIRFRCEADPLQRVRNRGGATMRQGWGSMISSLAAVGKLPRPTREMFACTECDNGPEGCKVCREKAEVRLRGSVLAMSVTFGMAFADELLHAGPRIAAAEELATRLGAVHARFATSSSDNPDHYWYVRTNERGELMIDVAQTSSHGLAPSFIDAEPGDGPPN